MVINHPQLLQSKGPLLLAANHPNSFLDGIILTTLFDQPLYSLARGDAFKHPKIKKILHWLQLLPVYRTTEGIENLEHNYTTFAACQKAFEEKDIVLIFSEANSKNEWHLRQLRKGTARLAVSSWEKNIPLVVLPTAINYNSFKHFGKTVHLYFGQPIQAEQIMMQPTHGKQLLAFNQLLQQQLQQYVYEISAADKKTINKLFRKPMSTMKLILLAAPALSGYLMHLPFFIPCKIFTHLFFNKSDHYDSVLTALLLLFYPLYIALIVIVVFPFSITFSLLSLFILPFTSWACMQFKKAINI